MPGWLAPIVEGAVAAIISAVLVAWIRRRLAARHRLALASGRPFRFDASLQGNVAPYPRHFRAGWVYVGVGAPVWKPRFSVVRRPIHLPMAAVVDEVRQLSGLGEILRVDSACRVIVARAGDVQLDLAVLPREVITVLQAFKSSTGEGWKVPAWAVDVQGLSRATEE